MISEDAMPPPKMNMQKSLATLKYYKFLLISNLKVNILD